MASAAYRSIGLPGVQDAGWPVDLLRTVWDEQCQLLAERIAAIERAAAALTEDRLTEGLRADAQRAAHMLAGSIGIFGLWTASDAARDLELELAHPTPARAATVRELLSRLPQLDRDPFAPRSRT